MPDDKLSIKRTANRIKKARQDASLTQAEVAEGAGVSVNHYAQIERGEKNPTVSTFKNILKAIGASSSDILGR